MRRKKSFSHYMESYIYDHRKLRESGKMFGSSLKEVSKKIQELEILKIDKKPQK